MSYLDQLLQQQQYLPQIGQQVGLKPGQAYASFYNPIEVSAPSYIQPNPYTMITAGYTSNEFAYSIIQKRALAKSQAVVKLCQYPDGEEVEEHPLLDLLHNPNPAPNMTWQVWEQMKQVTQDIAGFCAFEIEYSNVGDIRALWYMTPYWCSFLRGQQEPLRAIRYQPWGLQPIDIPFKDEAGRPKILFFSDGENFDPRTDRIRFRSPMMAAFPQVEVDNAMTFFLNDFVKHGAKFAGLISVAQTIDQTQADDYRRRWRDQHGGAENWSDPLILGNGATYSSMQMNFRDMAFPEFDARIELRICNAFGISTIVAGARAGLDVSSYNNKAQAQKDWYHDWVIPSWKSDADNIGTQLLPLYFSYPENYYIEFDFSDVYALKEDRDAQVKRAVDGYKAKVMKLNEARDEIGLPPVDDGDDFAADPPPQPFGNQNGNPFGKQEPEEDSEEKQDEVKAFRKFAKQRVKEGKSSIIASFEFKYHTIDEQKGLLSEFGIVTELAPELKQLVDAIHRLADQNERERIIVNVPQSNIEMVVPVPSVTNIVDAKAAPVTNTVNIPKKATRAKIRKTADGAFEIIEEQ